jgi:hypothetical protein
MCQFWPQAWPVELVLSPTGRRPAKMASFILHGAAAVRYTEAGRNSDWRNTRPIRSARSIVLAPAPQRGDVDFSAYRVSRRVYKCAALDIDGDHRMCSRFVSAENHYPAVPSNDLVP